MKTDQRHSTQHTTLRGALCGRLAVAILVWGFLVAGSCSHPASSVTFIVPDSHAGRVFIVHDALRGELVDVRQGEGSLEFPDSRILRVKTREAFELGDMWIRARTRSGQELYVRKGGKEMGPEFLSARTFLLSDDGRSWKDSDLRTPVTHLLDMGIENLKRSEATAPAPLDDSTKPDKDTSE